MSLRDLQSCQVEGFLLLCQTVPVRIERRVLATSRGLQRAEPECRVQTRDLEDHNLKGDCHGEFSQAPAAAAAPSLPVPSESESPVARGNLPPGRRPGSNWRGQG